MNSRGNTFLIISIIFLIALSAGGYWYWQTQNDKFSNTTPTPETNTVSSPILVETQNWKTYVNEEYGFSFKYPPDINNTSSSDNQIEFKITGLKQEGHVYLNDTFSFGISVSEKPTGTTLDQYIKNQSATFEIHDEELIDSNFKGKDVVKFEGFGGINPLFINEIYYQISDSQILLIYSYYTKINEQYYRQILSNILDSFEFYGT